MGNDESNAAEPTRLVPALTMAEAAYRTGLPQRELHRYRREGMFPNAWQGPEQRPWMIPAVDLEAAGLTLAPFDETAQLLEPPGRIRDSFWLYELDDVPSFAAMREAHEATGGSQPGDFSDLVGDGKRRARRRPPSPDMEAELADLRTRLVYAENRAALAEAETRKKTRELSAALRALRRLTDQSRTEE